MKTKNFPGHKVARQQAAIARNAAVSNITAKAVRAMDIPIMRHARNCAKQVIPFSTRQNAITNGTEPMSAKGI